MKRIFYNGHSTHDGGRSIYEGIIVTSSFGTNCLIDSLWPATFYLGNSDFQYKPCNIVSTGMCWLYYSEFRETNRVWGSSSLKNCREWFRNSFYKGNNKMILRIHLAFQIVVGSFKYFFLLKIAKWFEFLLYLLHLRGHMSKNEQVL